MRWLKRTTVAALVVVLLWLAGGAPAASILERAAKREVTEAFGVIPEFDDDQVYGETNAGGQLLIDAASELGLALVDSASAPPESPASSQVHKAVGEYVKQAMSDPSGRLDPLPDELVAFLDTHAGHLDDIAELLEHGDVRIQARLSPSSPKLIKVLYLGRVLVLDAIHRHLAGRDSGGRPQLVAAWRLSALTLEMPSLIHHLFGSAMLRNTLGAIRKLDADSGPWDQGLDLHWYRRHQARGFLSETSWFGIVFTEPRGVLFDEDAPSWLVTIVRPFWRPAAVVLSSSHRRRVLTGMLELDAADDCVTPLDAWQHRPAHWWNEHPQEAIDALARTLDGSRRTFLELELTRIVLERGVSGQRDAVSKEDTSEILPSWCRDGGWTVRTMRDGSVSITYSGAPLPDATQKYPLEYQRAANDPTPRYGRRRLQRAQPPGGPGSSQDIHPEDDVLRWDAARLIPGRHQSAFHDQGRAYLATDRRGADRCRDEDRRVPGRPPHRRRGHGSGL